MRLGQFAMTMLYVSIQVEIGTARKRLCGRYLLVRMLSVRQVVGASLMTLRAVLALSRLCPSAVGEKPE